MLKLTIVNPEEIRGTEYQSEHNDCTVRALAMAASLPYGVAHRYCELAGRQPQRGIPTSVIATMLGEKIANYKVTRIPITGRLTSSRYLRPTLADIRRQHKTGRYYVIIRGHALAMVDGVIYDGAPNGARCGVHALFELQAV